MGWAQKLAETYDNCLSEVGVFYQDKTPLLPIYHTTQQAHIEILIDSDGNFLYGRSRVITDKGDATTIIPCTEDSALGTNDRAPHPLFDKLNYLAGDYKKYANQDGKFDKYIKNLRLWCESPYKHPKIVSIMRYLEKGTLIKDLIDDGILFTNENNLLIDKWTDPDPPPIFKVVNSQDKAFVRIAVIPSDGSDNADIYPWLDKSLWNSFICYQDSLESDSDYCYATRNFVPISRLSPKKIRNPGDSAKLISSNDSSNFTYRGRFAKPEQAFCIGRETTEKAHNALRWLISKQGTYHDSQVIVAWGTKNEEIPPICADSLDLVAALYPSDEPVVFTNEKFANELNKAINGYKANLKEDNQAVVMGMDSATSGRSAIRGRLSIFYYRELLILDLIERIEKWHKTCSWKLEYRKIKTGKDEKGKEKYEKFAFVGAPAPKDIAEAAYGTNIKENHKKSIIERLLPCIIDGAKVPVDIMKNAARRASNPASFKEDWEYRKTLSIACALIRKYYNDKSKNKEVFKMGLDFENNDRNYLFGRILAYIREIESKALYDAKENRQTNAERLLNAFCRAPAKYCDILHKQLQPYLKRLGGKGFFLESEMMALISRLDTEFNNTPLNETFLLGYSAQMNHFIEGSRTHKQNETETFEE